MTSKNTTITPAALQQTRKIFHQILPVPDEQWQLVEPIFTENHFKKDEYLIRADSITDLSFIIMKGIVRKVYTLNNGEEYNACFALENSIVGSFTSMVLQTPSRFSFQALEDVEAVTFSRKDTEHLYSRSPFWEKFGRLSAEYSILQKELSEANELDSLETRYANLLQLYPNLNSRIPQHHIASHLRTTDEELLRLKKKLLFI